MKKTIYILLEIFSLIPMVAGFVFGYLYHNFRMGMRLSTRVGLESATMILKIIKDNKDTHEK